LPEADLFLWKESHVTLGRKEFLKLMGAVAATPYVGACSPSGSNTPTEGVGVTEGPDGLLIGSWPEYERAVVIDGLAGPLQINIPQDALPLSESALAQVAQSGITAVNLTVSALPTDSMTAYEATVAKVAAWIAEAQRSSDILTIARTTDEIRAAKRAGRLALILGFQDATPIEDDLDRLDRFHEDGVRIVQLTYNIANRIGVGCLAPDDTGLTELGREVVARLDDLGVLVDLSHCGPQTSLDGIRASSRPVSFTHTGCNAVYRHPRNKDDEALRLVAERGGVVGIYLMPFINEQGAPSAAHVLAHLDHALDVCGEDHVGIGTDQGIVPLRVDDGFQARFDEVSTQRAEAGIAAPREDTIPYVPELNHPRRIETIAALMAGRGHSTSVIEKVVGGNFMRLLGEIWS